MCKSASSTSFFLWGNREASSALFFLLPRFILWLSRLGTRGLLGLFWQGFWHDLLYWYFLSFFQVWEGFNDFAIFKFAISQHCQTKRQIGMDLKNGTTENLECLPRRAHFFFDDDCLLIFPSSEFAFFWLDVWRI